LHSEQFCRDVSRKTGEVDALARTADFAQAVSKILQFDKCVQDPPGLADYRKKLSADTLYACDYRESNAFAIPSSPAGPLSKGSQSANAATLFQQFVSALSQTAGTGDGLARVVLAGAVRDVVGIDGGVVSGW
jgi:hypothetical protein